MTTQLTHEDVGKLSSWLGKQHNGAFINYEHNSAKFNPPWSVYIPNTVSMPSSHKEVGELTDKLSFDCAKDELLKMCGGFDVIS